MNIQTLVMVTLLGVSAAQAQGHKYDTWSENYTVQALLGVVKYDHFTVDAPDSADPVQIDVSSMPQLGGAWTTVPKGNRLQFGLEATFLLGFRFDKINYLAAGGSGLYVSLSTSMWMFDLSGGGYASLFLDPGRKVRIYVGGGPLMGFADYRAKQDYKNSSLATETTSETAFGIGLYARTGIEFRIHDRGMLGAGVRSNWSNVDFTEVGGSSDLAGFAGFVTYSAGF
ncbi:hypothetical protein [Pontiella sp.]|uniref:hypothetical protein n=1 Tax=Pontiella sp. TaxID=2837462 RepID=UPI0035655323